MCTLNAVERWTRAVTCADFPQRRALGDQMARAREMAGWFRDPQQERMRAARAQVKCPRVLAREAWRFAYRLGRFDGFHHEPSRIVAESWLAMYNGAFRK